MTGSRNSHDPADRPAKPSFVPAGPGFRVFLVFILIFVALAMGIVGIGYTYYRQAEQHYLTKTEQELSAIADLKVDQLVQYRKERLGDGNTFFKNSAFTALVRGFLEKPEDAETIRKLQSWLGRFQTYYEYDHVSLFDARAVERLAVPGAPETVDKHMAQNIAAALQSGRMTMLDFYRPAPGRPLYLNVLVPVLNESDTNRPLGVLVLRINPETYLYPFIKRWPTPSPTAETLLVRRDGNDVLFLNDLRFQTNAALNLRIPLVRTNVPAVRAALGQTDIVPGVDYRGMPVLAAVRAVPGSPWFLVARKDLSEVYAPIRERLWLVIGMMTALLLGAAAGVGLVWRQQRVRFYRESENQFRALFEQATDGMLLADMKTRRFTLANLQIQRMLGYSEAELLQLTVADVHPAADLPAVLGQFEKQSHGEIPSISNIPMRRKDGTVFYADISASVVRLRQHEGLLGIFRDVTERKQAEAELRSREERLREVNALQRLLLPTNSIEKKAKLITDAVTQIVGADFARIWLIQPGDRCATGCVHARVVDGPHVCRFRDRCLHLLASSGRYTHTDGGDHARVPFGCYKIGKIAAGEEAGFLTNQVTTDPRVHNHAWARELGLVAFAGYRLADTNGTPLGVLALFSKTALSPAQDTLLQGIAHVTSQVLISARAEITLARTLADLQRSNRELEQFAYVASHDLQEPLRMVSSYTQLLARRYEGQLDEKAKKYVHYAVDGAVRMQTLIDDLLAYSRVGRQDKPIESTDSHSALGEARRNLAVMIEKTRAIITNDDLPTVRAVPSQLVMLFQNLISNAVKFQREGVPSVHVAARDDGREWVFSVRDNGIGIDPQHADRVFVIFQRLHTRDEYPGTGIGLAVCQRIVERHGGRIWFESKPGKGTTFFFTIPK